MKRRDFLKSSLGITFSTMAVGNFSEALSYGLERAVRICGAAAFGSTVYLDSRGKHGRNQRNRYVD